MGERIILGDEVHYFGRRAALFWETKCIILGDGERAKKRLSPLLGLKIGLPRFAPTDRQI